jgi:hypothetical protein
MVCRMSRRPSRPWRPAVWLANLGYITLDGYWAALDLFLERLQRDLPTAAEALGSWRQPAACRTLDSASCARCRAGARRAGRRRPAGPAAPRVAAGHAHDLRALPDMRDADLRARLAAMMDVLAGWFMDEVPAEVTLEKLHTAAELLLTWLWGRGCSSRARRARGVGGRVLPGRPVVRARGRRRGHDERRTPPGAEGPADGNRAPRRGRKRRRGWPSTSDPRPA